MDEVNDDLMGVTAAAKFLDATKDWVRDHCNRREPIIPHIRFGGKKANLKFRRRDLIAFTEAHFSGKKPRKGQ